MIHEKLKNIQTELKAPKGQINKFGGYKYRSCEDIMKAAKPVLAKYNCTLIVKDDVEFIGERFYVKATATLTDVETGETVETTAWAREPETKKGSDESQITGAASSYARKYCLNGLFLIDDTKDADATNTGKTPTNDKLTELKKQIVDKCKELGGTKSPAVMLCVEKLGNPNGIKTVKAAEEYLAELNKSKE